MIFAHPHSEAARIAFEVGFDAVDMKSCHGYLINELFGCRERQGKYGGSFENRTRFPDLQQAAGSYNAKRQYLAPTLARQLGVARFVSETHVMAGLWSAEVIHSVRLRHATFRALCPDPPDRLEAWLRGEPPHLGRSSTFVLLDPVARGRTARTTGLDRVLSGVRPRVRDYREAASRLR